MKYKYYQLLSFSLAILLCSASFSQNLPENVTQYVNPFIGTANNGNTFPGAVVPWGMVSVSPHNSPGSPSGYVHGEKYFYGFGQVHLSGTGCADLGSIIIIPTMGEIEINPEAYRCLYSGEEAIAGYYRVLLNDQKIISEASATARCSILRFSVDRETRINILVDVGRSLNLIGGGKVKLESNTVISGYNISGGFCGEANRQTIYFNSETNLVPESRGIWVDNRQVNQSEALATDQPIGCWLTYILKPENPLMIKTGISYVSQKNAKINLVAEIPDWNFEKIKKEASGAWQNELSKIRIEGGSRPDKIKFYTALYHMLIHPNIISDINGEYPLMGRTGIGRNKERNRYSVFSLWDTYRTLHPFLSLVYPERQSEILKTMIDMYKESGWFPKWELAGNETYMMVGDPATIVIADSYIKGIRDFDIGQALEGMLKSSILKKGEKAPPIRAGYHEQLEFGYIPVDQDTTQEWWVWGPVSTSLEYCLADWSISRIADKLNKEEISKIFLERSYNYKNLFDNQTYFLRPRLKNGDWLMPFDPLQTEGSGSWKGSGGPGYVEGNAWNYTWFVPHDVPGLIDLFGGGEDFSDKLRQCFINGQFTINNEPDIAYPYLFTYIKGKENLTSQLVNEIVQKEFGTGPDGLPGNDDCGTISGWLVFSMLGFYPTCPGLESYQMGIPAFEKAVIHLNSDFNTNEKFVIKRTISRELEGNISTILLNGTYIKDYQLKHRDIVKGGEIVFEIE